MKLKCIEIKQRLKKVIIHFGIPGHYPDDDHEWVGFTKSRILEIPLEFPRIYKLNANKA